MTVRSTCDEAQTVLCIPAAAMPLTQSQCAEPLGSSQSALCHPQCCRSSVGFPTHTVIRVESVLSPVSEPRQSFPEPVVEQAAEGWGCVVPAIKFRYVSFCRSSSSVSCVFLFSSALVSHAELSDCKPSHLPNCTYLPLFISTPSLHPALSGDKHLVKD